MIGIDITGVRFGRLVAVSLSPYRTKHGERRWDCVCDCGNTTSPIIASLRSGATRSCGCITRETRTAEGRLARFWSSTHQSPNGCIEWIGEITPGGYGRFYNGVRVMAHRFAYELRHGKIPDGLTVDHLCRNRCCVNADHLEAVTIRENTLRGVGPTAASARVTACPRGHPYAGANLYVNPQGWRSCRACLRDWKRAARERKVKVVNGGGW